MDLAYGAASLHIPFPDERIDCVVTSKAADIRPEADVARLVDAAMPSAVLRWRSGYTPTSASASWSPM